MTVEPEPYVVFVELTWNNGTQLVEVAARSASEAVDRAYVQLFEDYGWPDGADEPLTLEDGSVLLHGPASHREVRRVTIVKGTVCSGVVSL